MLRIYERLESIDRQVGVSNNSRSRDVCSSGKHRTLEFGCFAGHKTFLRLCSVFWMEKSNGSDSNGQRKRFHRHVPRMETTCCERGNEPFDYKSSSILNDAFICPRFSRKTVDEQKQGEKMKVYPVPGYFRTLVPRGDREPFRCSIISILIHLFRIRSKMH